MSPLTDDLKGPMAYLRRLLLAALLGLGVPGGYLGSAPADAANTKQTKKPVYTVDTKPLDDAEKQLTAAREAYKQANDKLGSVVDKLKAAWEAKPEVAAAIHATEAARVAYDAASNPVLANLENRSDYKAALSAREDAEKRVEAARSGDSDSSSSSDSSGDGESIAQAANDALVARNALTQIRVNALSGDAKTVAGKQTLSVAADKLNAMRAEFDASIKNDLTWSSAKKEVDDAQAKETAAQAAYDAAERKAAQEQAAKDAADAQQQKNNQSSGKKKK